MYASKSSLLLSRKRRAEIAQQKCLLIKYCHDTRYDTTKVVTHDLQKEEALVSVGKSLQKTIDSVVNLKQYNCIFIDEIQFFDDGAEVCHRLVNQGYDVTVCGLQGTYDMKIFPCIAELIPKFEEIIHLTAIDPQTTQELSFTARLTDGNEQELIGGLETYIAVDRQHYLSLKETKKI